MMRFWSSIKHIHGRVCNTDSGIDCGKGKHWQSELIRDWFLLIGLDSACLRQQTTGQTNALCMTFVDGSHSKARMAEPDFYSWSNSLLLSQRVYAHLCQYGVRASKTSEWKLCKSKVYLNCNNFQLFMKSISKGTIASHPIIKAPLEIGPIHLVDTYARHSNFAGHIHFSIPEPWLVVAKCRSLFAKANLAVFLHSVYTCASSQQSRQTEFLNGFAFLEFWQIHLRSAIIVRGEEELLQLSMGASRGCKANNLIQESKSTDKIGVDFLEEHTLSPQAKSRNETPNIRIQFTRCKYRNYQSHSHTVCILWKGIAQNTQFSSHSSALFSP